MKICFILPNVFPVPSTKGGAVETLVESLLKENELNYKIDFTCVSIFEEKAYEVSKNYVHTNYIYINNNDSSLSKDLSFSTFDSSFTSYMDNVYASIKNMDFDFIIIEGGDWIGYEYLVKKLPSQKFILHIHGVIDCSKKCSEIYDYYLSISNYVTNNFLSSGFVSKDKIFTLYNGIDLSIFNKTIPADERLSLRTKYGISTDDTVILFCGRTSPEKGVKELLLAFKKLHLDNVKLLIVGNSNFSNNVTTDYDRELFELSKDVSNKIIFTGFIHNSELYKIHNISDISVIPSIYEEGFGLVVVESMASGLPIITTNSGAIPEIVDDSCAFIIDKDDNMIDSLSDKLLYLINNPNIRLQMRKNGKKLCQKFDTKSFFNNFVNILQKMS